MQKAFSNKKRKYRLTIDDETEVFEPIVVSLQGNLFEPSKQTVKRLLAKYDKVQLQKFYESLSCVTLRYRLHKFRRWEKECAIGIPQINHTNETQALDSEIQCTINRRSSTRNPSSRLSISHEGRDTFNISRNNEGSNTMISIRTAAGTQRLETRSIRDQNNPRPNELEEGQILLSDHGRVIEIH